MIGKWLTNTVSFWIAAPFLILPIVISRVWRHGYSRSGFYSLEMGGGRFFLFFPERSRLIAGHKVSLLVMEMPKSRREVALIIIKYVPVFLILEKSKALAQEAIFLTLVAQTTNSDYLITFCMECPPKCSKTLVVFISDPKLLRSCAIVII